MWRGVARWRLKGALPETQRWSGAEKNNDNPKYAQQMHQGTQWENVRQKQEQRGTCDHRSNCFYKEAKEGAGRGEGIRCS